MISCNGSCLISMLPCCRFMQCVIKKQTKGVIDGFVWWVWQFHYFLCAFALIYHLEYILISEKNILINIEIWILTITSSRDGWTSDGVRVTGGKHTSNSSGAKCTAQMFLDSCQPVAYLQERVRNNLTSSFQSTVFEELPWALKTVPIVIDNTTQMQKAVNLWKYYVFHHACCILSCLLFLYCATKKMAVDLLPTSRYSPHTVWAVVRLLCADQIFHYSVSSPACNRVDQIHVQIVSDSQHSHPLATVSK